MEIPEDAVVQAVARHHKLPEFIARKLVEHSHHCDDAECEINQLVIDCVVDLVPTGTEVTIDDLVQIVHNASINLQHQIDLLQKDGQSIPGGKLMELLQNTVDAAQTEIQFTADRKRGDRR